MVTLSVCPAMPWAGLTDAIAGGAWSTVKPLVRVAVPAALVTETSLAPSAADPSMLMLAVIWVALSTVKLLTVTSSPKPTVVTPKRSVPVMATLRVCPWSRLARVDRAQAGQGHHQEAIDLCVGDPQAW